jgi:hypothetical protein
MWLFHVLIHTDVKPDADVKPTIEVPPQEKCACPTDNASGTGTVGQLGL